MDLVCGMKILLLTMLCAGVEGNVTIPTDKEAPEGSIIAGNMTAALQYRPIRFCDYAEFNQYYKSVCPGSNMIGYHCVKVGFGWKTWWNAVTTCRNYGLHLVDVLNQRQRNDYVELLGYDVWIGVRRRGGVFRREIDGTRQYYLPWSSDNPDNYRGREHCVEILSDGWNDNTCGWATNKFACREGTPTYHGEEYYKFLYTEMDPPSGSHLKIGDTITIKCNARSPRDHYWSVQATIYGATGRDELYKANKASTCNHDCSWQHWYTYYHDGTRCIEENHMVFTMKMDEELSGVYFKCCNHMKSSPYLLCSLNLGSYYLRATPNKPVLRKSVGSKAVLDGTYLTWTCDNDLGSKFIGSVALISWDDCGVWLATFNMAVEPITERHYLTRFKCPQVISAVSTRQRGQDQSNHIIVSVRVMVTGHLREATLACFSYDASEKFEKGTLLDQSDPLAAHHGPLEVIYAPLDPRLVVHYHGPYGRLFKQMYLTAVCDGYVGSQGSIKWILRRPFGDQYQSFTTQYYELPPYTPANMTITQSPNPVTRTCPYGWTGSVPSGTCLKVTPGAYSWTEARRLCLKDGSDLVQIYSARAFDVVNRLVGQDGYWIGLTDSNKDGRFSWLGRGRKVAFKEWVEVVDKKVEPSLGICVYLHKDELFTHGCKYRLRAVCETPPGTYISDAFFSVEKGPRARSVFKMLVDDTLESATLECKIYNSRVQQSRTTQRSLPFRIAGELPKPTYQTRWTITKDKYSADVSCRSHVGTNGSVSLAVFSDRKVKYIYLVDVDKNVYSIHPAAAFRLNYIKVRTLGGNATVTTIDLRATIDITQDVSSPFVICYNFRIYKSSVLDLNDDDIMGSNVNVERSISGTSHTNLLAFGLLVWIVAVFLILVTKKKYFDPLQTGEGPSASTSAHGEGE